MSAIAAAKLGYRCLVLSPEPDCPASHVAAHLCAPYDDQDALERFARAVDVATFEFENVSADGLATLERLVEVRPGTALLRISQDRAAEKSFLDRHGIAVAPWRAVADRAGLDAALAAIGTPAILKTATLGYDGKGQVRIDDPAEADRAHAALAPAACILEGVVDFALEVSVIVARGADGTVSSFDPTENRHRDGILDVSLAPARLPEPIAADAAAIARRIAEATGLVGLLAVEMFVDPDGRVLVNEIAPRPHNSGHWTIEACQVSQFEMHVRAVAGMALPPGSRHADALMKNLIGPEGIAHWARAASDPGASAHHYGKQEARPGRKMGHVTWLFPRGSLPGELGVESVLGPFE